MAGAVGQVIVKDVALLRMATVMRWPSFELVILTVVLAGKVSTK
jgi:hypothetical protein